MKKKQIKHFVSEKSKFGNYGYPVCRCYGDITGYLVALSDECSITKRGITCKNCRRTRVFRKLK
ncbi:hypothetical protein LCGC14_2559550 [marine sediment metagenome]|uniref:Uncharacterized protein n=1 Tax=marine sediment metagenome TaxID=412755 RepID=A0A0F9DDI6_9ZZZZ